MGGIVMKEDYVSFEVAKLLKEKGFNEFTQTGWGAYDSKEEPRSFIPDDGRGGWYDTKKEWLSRPTLQMAMKWLREVHLIHTDIIIEGNGSCIKYYSNIRPFKIIYSTRFGDSIDTIKVGTYNTYEEAASAAIKYCLENLI